ncbi:MAG: GNAT family N-acetyltransferase [Pyrinomonadaceae bacterium]
MNDIKLKRTNSDDADFQELVSLLDNELRVRDGDEHSFYAQFNKLDSIKHAVVVFADSGAVGCGAIKRFDEFTVEIKRMYVREAFRGMGIAVSILNELEKWASEIDFEFAILETGYNQPEAIRLYQKTGYLVTENYGQYEGVENSVCMKKKISE